MKERPILMNGDMVRAVLAGKKTQTRRLVKNVPDGCYLGNGADGVYLYGKSHINQGAVACPFGEVGDRLWVRETISCGSKQGHEFGEPVYAADGYCDVLLQPHTTIAHEDLRWTPSIHMPKWASRITLEITNVRVQRVNEISFHDCLAEGIKQASSTQYGSYQLDTMEDFRKLWESIYGRDSWTKWVWAITFKRIDQ